MLRRRSWDGLLSRSGRRGLLFDLGGFRFCFCRWSYLMLWSFLGRVPDWDFLRGLRLRLGRLGCSRLFSALRLLFFFFVLGLFLFFFSFLFFAEVFFEIAFGQLQVKDFI